MKSRIKKSEQKLIKHFKSGVEVLNNNSIIFLHKDFVFFKTVIRDAYASGYLTESEFIDITKMLGKNLGELNSKGFIQKSIIQIVCDITNSKP